MKNVPINKGNYSLDTAEREAAFDRNRAFGVEEEYRRNRHDWVEYPKRRFVAPYPLLVDLELSSLCNLSCRFCYTVAPGFRERVGATLMDFALFRKVIDEIGGKVFAIRLSLRGEPTLHPEFLQAIRYAKEAGIREVSTLTNASLMTPEYFEQAMEAGIDWITVSFDGLGEEYEKNRHPLKYPVMYERLAQWRRIRERAGRVKPVVKVQTVWPAIERDPDTYYRQMAEVCDLVAFNPLVDVFSHPDPDSIAYDRTFLCPQLYQRLVVAADGRVILCANDDNSERIVGDARLETIREIWHGEALNAVRRLHLEPEGFKTVPVCRFCYLPRQTREDRFELLGRELLVRNYR